MNSKKEAIKRAIAFTSALSFLAVNNLNAVNAVAKTTTVKTETAVSAEKKEGQTTVPQTTTATTTAVTTTTSASTSVQTTTTVPTTTTTIIKTESVSKQTIEFYVDVNKLSENEKNYFLNNIANKVKSLLENETDIPDINNIYYDYNATKVKLDFYGLKKDKIAIIKKLEDSFNKFVANERLYKCKIENQKIVCDDVYYRFYYNNLECFETGIFTESFSSSDNVEIEQDNYYLKKGTELNGDSFNLKSGFLVNNNGSMSVKDVIKCQNTNNDKIIIYNNNSYNNNYMEIVKSSATIIFNDENVFDKNGEKIKDVTCNWGNAGSQKVSFKSEYENGSVSFLYNDVSVNFEVGENGYIELTVNELLGKWNKKIDEFNPNGTKYEISVAGIPAKVKAKRKTSNLEVEEECNYYVDGEKINIPYIYQKNSKTYYLKKYSLKYSGIEDAVENEFSFDDVYSKLNNGSYYSTPEYGKWSDKKLSRAEEVFAEYEEIVGEVSELTDSEKIKALIISSFIESSIINGKRNENIISVENKLNYTINFGAEYAGYIFNLVDNTGFVIQLVVDEFGSISLYNQYNDIIFNKFAILAMKTENGEIITFSMTPFVIYFDNTAPTVSVTEDNETKKDWKNGSCQFNITVSDKEKATSPYDDQQEVIDQINDTPNLESVKTIYVAGAKFESENGWIKNSYSAISEDGKYNVKIVKVFDKDNKWNGEFKAFVSISDTKIKGVNEEITIYAVDNCGNKSDQQKALVKIDIGEPKAKKINIPNLKKDVLQNGEKLDVSANISDIYEDYAYSGIKNVTFSFVKEINKDSESDISKSQNGNTDSGIYEAEFELNNENLRGYVVINVEDNAGNSKKYYYMDSENGVTDIPKNATQIIIDNTNPAVSNVDVNGKAYEIDDKSWYDNYYKISFKGSDDDSGSGVETLIIAVNDTITAFTLDEIKALLSESEQDTDVAEYLKNGKFYIDFVADSKDKYSFNPFLKIEGLTSSIALGEKQTLKENGEINFKVQVIDYAENYSDEITKTIYIDNTKPEVKGTFAPAHKEDNVKIRKYGTFHNDSFVIRIPISDGDKVASSGYKSATLKLTTKSTLVQDFSYVSDKFDNNDVIFILPENEYKKISENSVVPFSFEVTLTDNVGNVSGFTAVMNESGSDNIVIENIIPAIPEPEILNASTGKSIKDDIDRYVNKDNELWYSGDVTVQYNVNDNQSGLSSVQMYYNSENPQRKTADSKKDYTEKTDAEYSDTFELSTEKDVDGKADFSINVTDNAGNTNEKTFAVYKDITNPVVTGFSFGNSDFDDGNESESPAFTHFKNDNVEMTIFVEDLNASAGLKAIYCELYNTDGSVYASEVFEITEKSNDGKYSVKYTIPEGFKGDIKAWAVDNVNNKSVVSCPNGYISENGATHEANSGINIILPETNKSDVKGLPLYANDITAKFEVTDTYSGIRNIRWQTSDMDSPYTIDINPDGTIKDTNYGWTVLQTERNIAVKLEKEIVVSKDANNNYITVMITDNSGNTTEKTVNFSIDKTIPVISVSGIESSEEVKYYNSHKDVNVSVAERNFDNPVINDNSDGGFATDSTTQEGTDGYRHYKNFVFDTDGRYTLDISNNDLAGNKSVDYKSGTFVIDTVAPVSTIEVRGGGGSAIDLDESIYISDTVNALVAVEEVNFDAGLVKVTVNGNTYTPSAWLGDTNHTATIPTSIFDEDGSYTISVSGNDLAGNALRSNSVFFVRDTKKPEIKISGVSAANGGDVKPVIVVNDSNLNTQNIALYKNGKEIKGIFNDADSTFEFNLGDGQLITGSWTNESTENGTKKTFTFDNFPKEEIFDGIYEIKADAKDKAGNKKSESTKFSVNRFGSVFTVEDFDNINGRYLNAPPVIVIRERNVDKHKSDSDVVIIVDKGSNTVKLTDSMYTVSDAVALDDNSGYEYTYNISAENFGQDLDYSISIQSVDEAGNKNVSTGRGAEVNFSVDTHAPEFKCDDLVDRAEFKESSREFRLNVNENLKHVKVTTSLGETLLDEDVLADTTSFVFNVPASNSSRNIIVELIDLAGNKTVKNFANLLVTENVVLFVMHKTWAKVAGGSALAVLGAVGGFLFVRKRKKRNY